jgi:predicted enzyme related to lactoylglutathione lyase
VPRISYLDFSADEPERAIKFYSAVFGWQIRKWEGPFEYWEIKTGEPNEPGIDGGLAKRSGPERSLTPFINVPSADHYTYRVEANGGKIVQAKTAIPGIGYMVIFKDTENNLLGLMEEDRAAK